MLVNPLVKDQNRFINIICFLNLFFFLNMSIYFHIFFYFIIKIFHDLHFRQLAKNLSFFIKFNHVVSNFYVTEIFKFLFRFF